MVNINEFVFFCEQNQNKCIWFNPNQFLNDSLFAKSEEKKIVIDLSSLSCILPSWSAVHNILH